MRFQNKIKKASRYIERFISYISTCRNEENFAVPIVA